MKSVRFLRGYPTFYVLWAYKIQQNYRKSIINPYISLAALF